MAKASSPLRRLAPRPRDAPHKGIDDFKEILAFGLPALEQLEKFEARGIVDAGDALAARRALGALLKSPLECLAQSGSLKLASKMKRTNLVSWYLRSHPNAKRVSVEAIMRSASRFVNDDAIMNASNCKVVGMTLNKLGWTRRRDGKADADGKRAWFWYRPKAEIGVGELF